MQAAISLSSTKAFLLQAAAYIPPPPCSCPRLLPSTPSAAIMPSSSNFTLQLSSCFHAVQKQGATPHAPALQPLPKVNRIHICMLQFYAAARAAGKPRGADCAEAMGWASVDRLEGRVSAIRNCHVVCCLTLTSRRLTLLPCPTVSLPASIHPLVTPSNV